MNQPNGVVPPPMTSIPTMTNIPGMPNNINMGQVPQPPPIQQPPPVQQPPNIPGISSDPNVVIPPQPQVPLQNQGQILQPNPEFMYQQPNQADSMAQADPSMYTGQRSESKIKMFILAPFYIFSNFFIVVSRDFELKKVYKLGIIHSIIGLVLSILRNRPEVSFCMVLGYVIFLLLYYYIVPSSEHSDALKATLKRLKVLRASNMMSWIQVKMSFLFGEVKPKNNFDSEDYDEEEDEDEDDETVPQQAVSQPSSIPQPQSMPSVPKMGIQPPPITTPQPPFIKPPPIITGSMMNMQPPPVTNTDFEEQDDDAL